MRQSVTSLLVLALASGLACSVRGQAVPTAFTYQGSLQSASMPLNATADLQFRLFDAGSGGGQVGSTLQVSGVLVQNGQVSASLDFGTGAFAGSRRWLEVAVRSPAGSGAYTTLGPRQEVTAAPYATYASQAALSANASSLNGQAGAFYTNAANLTGTLADARLTGNVARLNGYAGPIDLTIDGGPDLSGKLTLPAGGVQGFVPLLVKAGAKPGLRPFRLKATATADGKTVERYATQTDLVKAAFGGMANPPLELLEGAAVAVIDRPPFTLSLKADPAAVEKGKAGKLLVDATREKEADGDIALAPLFAPPNVTLAAKAAVAKGATKGDIGVTVAPAAGVGPAPLVIRATTKVGGKDYALTPAPVAFDVIDAKKAEPKKDEPKK